MAGLYAPQRLLETLVHRVVEDGPEPVAQAERHPVGVARRELALPGQHEATLGYSLASAMLARFPAGDCRVVITVKDTISSSQTASTLEFTLIR